LPILDSNGIVKLIELQEEQIELQKKQIELDRKRDYQKWVSHVILFLLFLAFINELSDIL